MDPLRALLVDDEMLAIRRLSRSLERIKGVEVIGSTTSAREAVDLIAAEQPDLLFLDIAMPGLTGFEVIERMKQEVRPAIIFVTAFDSHAARAFDVAAVYYLMQPFAQARLEEAVERARTWLQARSAPETVRGGIDALWVHRHR